MPFYERITDAQEPEDWESLDGGFGTSISSDTELDGENTSLLSQSEILSTLSSTSGTRPEFGFGLGQLDFGEIFGPNGLNGEDYYAPDGNFQLADTYVNQVLELRLNFDMHFENETITARSFPTLKEILIDPADKLMEELASKVRDADDTRDAFDVIINAAGPRTAEYLECFCIRVDAQAYEGTVAHRRFFYACPSDTFISRGPLQLCVKPPKGFVLGPRERLFWENLAPEHPHEPFFQMPADSQKLQEYEFHWIFLDRIVEALGPYHVDRYEDEKQERLHRGALQLDRLEKILRSFLKVADSEFVFETIPARAITTRSFQVTFKQFMHHFINSIFIVFCLAYIVYQFNSDPAVIGCMFHGSVADGTNCQFRHDWLTYFCYAVTLLLCTSELFTVVFDFFVFVREDQLNEFLTGWNFGEVFMEVFSIIGIFILGTLDFSKSLDPAWLLPVVVVIRWVKLGCCMLRLEVIGITTVPCFLALFSPPAMMTFTLIVVLTIAVTHAYYAFRVVENDHTFAYYGSWGTFEALNRMFRLVMFNHDDADELSGRLQEMVQGADGSLLIDEESTGSWGEVGQFTGHFMGLAGFIFFALMLGIVLMNVYIAVLRLKYVEYYGHRYHYYHQWRAKFQIRQLLRRKWWALLGFETLSIVAPLPCYDGVCEGQQGVWIVSAPAPKDQLKENGSLTAGMQHEVKEIQRSLGITAAQSPRARGLGEGEVSPSSRPSGILKRANAILSRR